MMSPEGTDKENLFLWTDAKYTVPRSELATGYKFTERSLWDNH